MSALTKRVSEGLSNWKPPDNSGRINARWTNEELLIAVQGVRKYGKDFRAIADVIGTKNETHVRMFFISYRKRYNLDAVLREYEEENGPIPEDEKVMLYSFLVCVGCNYLHFGFRWNWKCRRDLNPSPRLVVVRPSSCPAQLLRNLARNQLPLWATLLLALLLPPNKSTLGATLYTIKSSINHRVVYVVNRLFLQKQFLFRFFSFLTL